MVQINLPQFVIIKPGAIKSFKDICEKLKTNKIVIVHDITMETAADEIKENLVCMISSQITKIKPESLEKEYLEKTAKETDANLIIAVGGGRTIDAAKYIAYTIGCDWLSFPTILSHDGVVSSRAAIQEGNIKISVKAKEPLGIIVDTEIIKKAPYKYNAAGAADVIANQTSVEDWKIAKEHGKEYNSISAELALLSSKAVIENLDEIKNMTNKGISILTWSLICSGTSMNINQNSIPASGSEHNFSHALEKLNSPIIHGVQCAVGSIISSYLQNTDWKKLKEIYEKLNIPLTAKKLNVSDDLLIDALVLARDIRDRYTVLNTIDINRKKAIEILKTVGII